MRIWKPDYFLYYFIINILIIYCNSCFALSEKQAAQFFHLNQNHFVKFLDIKGYQQTTDYTCGPAIVMSLLKYYGRLNDQQMNHDTEMQIAKEMGTSQAQGTDEKQIVAWLNNHGFTAQSFHDGSIDVLRQHLAKGTPILVDWIDWGGHWAAIAGYDFAGNVHDMSQDTLFLADPAEHFDNLITKDGITFINPERFACMWFNSKLQKNIYIVATPK